MQEVIGSTPIFSTSVIPDSGLRITTSTADGDSELGIGKVTYSELDIAKMLGIDLRTLRKYENHL